MSFSNLQLSIANISLAVLGAVLAGLLLWWLIRKRQKRLWLPTVRILDLERSLLPKMQLKLPPLLPFVCFCVASFAVVFLSLSPEQKVFTPFEPSQAHYHIYLDFSPSMEASMDLSEYRGVFSKLWGTLSKNGRVTVSSTHSPIVYSPSSLLEAEAFFEQLDFHRAGVRLGEALKKQLEDFGGVDRLFIVSDGDAHSWTDLNWRYLSSELEVSLVGLAAPKKAKRNLFIDSVAHISSPATETSEWQVEVVRVGDKSSIENGLITVTYEGVELTRSDFNLPAGVSRLLLRTAWNGPTYEALFAAKPQTTELQFRLTVENQDDVKSDNLFRTNIRGMKQNGILIAAPAGEMMLEDPTHHLQKSLQVLDFRMRRVDELEQPGPKPEDYPFWVVVGGDGAGVDHFCPVGIESARLKLQDQSNALGGKMPIVWLAPAHPGADFQELCWCFVRLATSSEPVRSMPDYCKEATTRERYIGVLSSLGAKQVGGSLTELDSAVAFNLKDLKSNLEVMAMTIPFTPQRQTGMTYASLPLFVKGLLEWQGMISVTDGRAVEDWPRIADLSVFHTKVANSSDVAQKEISNVPPGESLLNIMPAAELPPRWVSFENFSQSELAVKRDQSDPKPWIYLCALIVILALCMEALWLGVGYLRKLANAALILLVWQGFGGESTSLAAMSVNTIFSDPVRLDAERLSEEVSLRTSIDLNPQILSYSQFDEGVKRESWVWVDRLSTLTDTRGEMRRDVVDWIKRGGFLVIQGNYTDDQMTNLTEKPFAYASMSPRWQPIPPDHELMRSFHLLESLPVCRGRVWKGFHFDGRLAILMIPFGFLQSMLDVPTIANCKEPLKREYAIRVFINLVMVVLATDYKKDQIHLPEILKRLR